MTKPPALTGQDIAEAHGAVTSVLNNALDGSPVTSPEWITFRVIAARGPWPTADLLSDYLASQSQLGLDRSAAQQLVDGLVHKGWIVDGAPVAFTSAGTELFDNLNEAVGRVAAKLYEGLRPDDLTIARNVLAQLTERARAMA